ncbi:MAG: DNA primase [Patescibacteria group bacterium]|jgi:DNA primase
MSDNSVIEEIKSKIDIVQLISEYIQLRKAGVNFRAPCPFHHEQDPSFYVTPDRQRWHCFGCGEDGDIFTFVMKIDGVDFVEALRHLAKKAGVVLKHVDLSEDKGRQRLHDANRWAARYYHEVLMRSPQAERARAYCAKRELKEETLEDFLIGYSPDSWDALLNFLRKKEFTDDEIFRAGLVSKKERGGGYFDRFRGRLMFSITDAQGNHVGFTGRVMPGPDGKDPPKEGKYVNTQETAVYRKSRILFLLDKAKSEIRKQGFAVVVEGNMDAIASHQAGVKNVVASSGTAFTEEQLALFKHKTDKLVLSFDMDAAGEQAARRSIDLAVSHGFEVRVLRLPPGAGKDPDDCIRKDVKMWQQAIADAAPFMQWYLDLARQRLKPEDPYAKRKTSAEILAEIAKLPSAAERAHWLRELAELVETPEGDLRREFEKLAKPSPAGAQPAAPVALPSQPQDREDLVSRTIFGAALNWPDLAETVFAAVKPEFLAAPLRQLYTEYVVFYNEQRTGGPQNSASLSRFAGNGDPKTAETIAIMKLLSEKELGDFPEDQRRDTLTALMGEIKRLHIGRRQRELTAAMSRAEKAGDATSIQDIQRQLSELML